MKRLLLTIALFLLFSTAAVYATTGTENISVKPMNVAISVNIVDIYICKDANGNEVIPFIYEGTTFVPIRTIATIFQKEVVWDSAANTISISAPQWLPKWSKEDEYAAEVLNNRKLPQKTISVTYRDIKILIDGKELTPTDANGKVVEPFIYSGTTFVPLRAISEAFDAEVEWLKLPDEDQTIGAPEGVGLYDYAHIKLTTDSIITSKDLGKWLEELRTADSSSYGLNYLFPDKPVFGTYQIVDGSNYDTVQANSVALTSYKGTMEIIFACGDLPENLQSAKSYIRSEEGKAKIQSIIDKAAEIFGENAEAYVSISEGSTTNRQYYSELWYPTFMSKAPEVVFSR
jgi:hypothetical protein